MVSNYLQHTTELKEAIQLVEDSFQEVLTESSELYTVLHHPELERVKNVCEAFVLSDAPKASNTSQESSVLEQIVSLFLII